MLEHVRPDPSAASVNLDKAHRALAAADSLAATGDHDDAVTLAYKAARLAVDALLAGRGLRIGAGQPDRHQARVPHLEAELRAVTWLDEVAAVAIARAYGSLMATRHREEYRAFVPTDSKTERGTARKVVRQVQRIFGDADP